MRRAARDRRGIARLASDSTGSPPRTAVLKKPIIGGQVSGVLRLRIGRAQIKRLRRRRVVPRRRRQAAPPNRYRARAAARHDRRRVAGRPGRASMRRRCRPGAARRSPRTHAPRAAARCAAPPGAAAGSERLQIDMPVPRIDATTTGSVSSAAIKRRGEGGECREPDRRLAGGKRDAARGGNADPQSGKAAGPVVTAMRSSSANIEPAASSRARSAASALRHGRAPSERSCRRRRRARYRARRPSRRRARYRWQGRAWTITSRHRQACPAKAAIHTPLDCHTCEPGTSRHMPR